MPRSLPFHLPSIRKTVRLTHCTSHSVRRRRAFEAGGATADAITSNLVQTLRANHARVLDFFRQADTNFDGVISKGEMTYALHTLGLNASPKELESLFLELDPSGDGVLEFAELQGWGEYSYAPVALGFLSGGNEHCSAMSALMLLASGFL